MIVDQGHIYFFSRYRMKKYQRKADDAKNMYDTFNQV